MLVLGVTDGISCGASLVKDGVVLAAVNEEALSRLKMAYGFPRASIAEVLRIAGVDARDVDAVRAATENNYLYDGIRPWKGWFGTDRGPIRNMISRMVGELSGLAAAPGAEWLYYWARQPIFRARRARIRQILADEFGCRAPVEFVDHHYAHATSSYFTSGFDDALAVTMDGGGDGASSHIYLVRDGSFEKIAHTSAFNSVANFYAYVTELAGFTAQKHEGKITGLAAHGRPVYLDLLNDMIRFEDGELRNRARVMYQSGVQALRDALPSNWNREDLAASIQVHCENLAVCYIEHHLSRLPNPPSDLALAGGLFANVRINQKVAEARGVERIFVHPGMTDAGLALGAAISPRARQAGTVAMPHAKQAIGNVYLGPEYSEEELQSALREVGLNGTRHDNIERRIAELLRDGYVVARFTGRMEYGPRALGNRSILYHPGDPSVNDWLNVLLKRSEFMPFAPSTLMEEAERSYHGVDRARDSARFMTVTFDCTEWMCCNCPGVVHIDGTARPQLVRAQDNPSYHRIIDEFRKLTGVGSIINTSFNMHEEPIVCTPRDAVRSFLQGHLDYLALGSLLVAAPGGPQHEVRPMSTAVVTEPAS